MEISKDAVVAFHYTIFDDSNQALESSHGQTPTLYLHGSESVLPHLQTALEGHKAGDKVEATLTPDKAYGERQDNLTQRISAKYLRHLKKYQVGDVVPVNTDKGQQWVTVLKKGLKTVDVDANHPFAGKTLRFVVEIDSVRAATEEELAHGHAHGAGGVEH